MIYGGSTHGARAGVRHIMIPSSHNPQIIWCQYATVICIMQQRGRSALHSKGLLMLNEPVRWNRLKDYKCSRFTTLYNNRHIYISPVGSQSYHGSSYNQSFISVIDVCIKLVYISPAHFCSYIIIIVVTVYLFWGASILIRLKKCIYSLHQQFL